MIDYKKTLFTENKCNTDGYASECRNTMRDKMKNVNILTKLGIASYDRRCEKIAYKTCAIQKQFDECNIST